MRLEKTASVSGRVVHGPWELKKEDAGVSRRTKSPVVCTAPLGLHRRALVAGASEALPSCRHVFWITDLQRFQLEEDGWGGETLPRCLNGSSPRASVVPRHQ